MKRESGSESDFIRENGNQDRNAEVAALLKTPYAALAFSSGARLKFFLLSVAWVRKIKNWIRNAKSTFPGRITRLRSRL